MRARRATASDPRREDLHLGAGTRPSGLLSEAVRSAVARPIATAATALVVAVVCLVVLLTTGRSAAAEHAVLSKLDSMGSRVVVVFDNGGSAGMKASSVASVASIESVSWALGLGPVRDVRNTHLEGGNARTPARTVYGDVTRAVTLESGRWPGPGEAIAATSAARELGLVDAVGAVSFPTSTDAAVPVVGTFSADAALGSVATSVLIAPPAGHDPHQAPLYFIFAMATSVGAVDPLASAVDRAVTAEVPSAVSVETAGGLTALRQDVATEMGASSRYVMLTTLGVGLFLVMITMFAAIAERRRDYGRRRALGASRSAIVVMVLAQACLAGLVGVLAGCGTGLALAALGKAALPPLTFVAGIAILALLTTTAAAVPPAFSAAGRDPLRVLRVA